MRSLATNTDFYLTSVVCCLSLNTHSLDARLSCPVLPVTIVRPLRDRRQRMSINLSSQVQFSHILFGRPDDVHLLAVVVGVSSSLCCCRCCRLPTESIKTHTRTPSDRWSTCRCCFFSLKSSQLVVVNAWNRSCLI